MLSLIKTNLKSIYIAVLLCFGLCSYAVNLDSIPLSAIYSGYRVELIDLKITTKNAEKLIGTVTLVNSGKFPITLGAFGYRSSKLKVLFDTDLDQASREAIITSIINSTLALDPGDMKKNFAFQADIKNYKNQWSASTSNSANPAIKSPAQNTKAEKANANNLTDNDEVPVVEKTENKVVFEKINTTDCPDLVISALTIKKQTKRNLQIEYTLTNQGNTPALIYDKKKNEFLALAAYFSASARLSRGSLIAGGDIISKGLEQSGGNLEPGGSYTGRINISLSSRSRYLNTLILSADSRQVVYECIENNNNKGIPID